MSSARAIPWMKKILHQLIGSLSHYSQGFIHPKWCRISSINSMPIAVPHKRGDITKTWHSAMTRCLSTTNARRVRKSARFGALKGGRILKRGTGTTFCSFFTGKKNHLSRLRGPHPRIVQSVRNDTSSGTV